MLWSDGNSGKMFSSFLEKKSNILTLGKQSTFIHIESIKASASIVLNKQSEKWCWLRTCGSLLGTCAEKG